MDLVETYQEELRFARKPVGRALLVGLIVLLAALPWWAPASWLSRASLVWLVAIGIVGQNLLIGYAGQISFGQAGFLAVGAYTFGHLRIAGTPFPLALLAAGAVTAGVGWLVGFPSLRLKGPYLAIATLGFGTAVYQIFTNVPALSGGHAGLALPALAVPAGLSRDVFTYVLFYAIFLLFTGVAYDLVSSYVGRAFVAIRDSDIAAEAMGVNLARYKLLAFAVSSFYTGIHGALLAQYLGHVEPQSFSLQETMTIFVAVIVGGLASIEGSVFGAAFAILVPALFGDFRWAIPVLFGGAPMTLALPLALVAGAVVAMFFYFGALVPAQRKGATPLGSVILTIGLSLVLQGFTVWNWGAEPDRFPFPLSDTKVWKVGPVFVSELAAGTLAAAAAASLLLFLLTQRTRLGLAMRATSENLAAAQTLGIPTRAVLAFAWGTAAALGVVAGVFLAPALLLDPFYMLDPMFKGLAAAVLGGMNSLPGAVLGGLILGVAESLAGGYVAIEFKSTMAFVLIVGVLLVRPEGLLGREFQERV